MFSAKQCFTYDYVENFCVLPHGTSAAHLVYQWQQLCMLLSMSPAGSAGAGAADDVCSGSPSLPSSCNATCMRFHVVRHRSILCRAYELSGTSLQWICTLRLYHGVSPNPCVRVTWIFSDWWLNSGAQLILLAPASSRCLRSPSTHYFFFKLCSYARHHKRSSDFRVKCIASGSCLPASSRLCRRKVLTSCDNSCWESLSIVQSAVFLFVRSVEVCCHIRRLTTKNAVHAL